MLPVSLFLLSAVRGSSQGSLRTLQLRKIFVLVRYVNSCGADANFRFYVPQVIFHAVREQSVGAFQLGKDFVDLLLVVADAGGNTRLSNGAGATFFVAESLSWKEQYNGAEGRGIRKKRRNRVVVAVHAGERHVLIVLYLCTPRVEHSRRPKRHQQIHRISFLFEHRSEECGDDTTKGMSGKLYHEIRLKIFRNTLHDGIYSVHQLVILDRIKFCFHQELFFECFQGCIGLGVVAFFIDWCGFGF